MSKLLAKMERKFGKYAIRNLPLCMVILYSAGYIAFWVNPTVIQNMSLNVERVFHGQVWRLFSWIMVPDLGMNVFMVAISLYIFYMLGHELERVWGTFLFNFFFFSGCFFIMSGVFVAVGLSALMCQTGLLPYDWFLYFYCGNFSGAYYLDMSLFLAYAIVYPDARFLVMFIFPIKAKVLGFIYVILLAFGVFQSFLLGTQFGVVSLVTVTMSLLNVIMFFIWTKRGNYKSPKEVKRQRDYKVKIKKATAVSRHKCAICGQTPENNPQLQFRYCSKCEGNYEYCSEHLFTHEHVKK